MKFVCRKCENFMLFRGAEEVAFDSLGVEYSCPTCGVSVSMITNPGETNLVNSLGVKVGGRESPKPFEFTQSILKSQEPIASGGGKCPFPEMVSQTKSAPPLPSRGASVDKRSFLLDPPKAVCAGEGGVTWTKGAQARLDNVPSFVMSFAKQAIEQMARDSGLTQVDEKLMDEAKSKFMEGS